MPKSSYYTLRPWELLALIFTTFVMNDESSRPMMAFTPSHGWMNDRIVNLRFQKMNSGTCTTSTIPTTQYGGTPLYWGHATSKIWKDCGATIGPIIEDGSFLETVGWPITLLVFNDSIDPRLKSGSNLPYNTEGSGSTCCTLDGGYTFEKYNPVLDVDSIN